MSGDDNNNALTPSVRVHTDGDKFQPVTRDDVSDLGGLPRRFDMFVAEVRESLKLLTDRIVVPITKIAEQVADLVERVSAAERQGNENAYRLDDHERRIAALEADKAPKPPTPRKKRRKTTTRKKARR